MVLGTLLRLGDEYHSMARTLGASSWQRLRYVTLPMVSPAVASSSLVVFAFVFGAFEIPYLLGRSYPAMLSVVAQRQFMNADLIERPAAVAIAIVIDHDCFPISLDLYATGAHSNGSWIGQRFSDYRDGTFIIRSVLQARLWAKRLAAIATLGLSIGPIALLLLTSLARHWYWPAFLPREYSVQAWTDIASPSSGASPHWPQAAGIALAVTVLALMVGLPAGRALGLHEFRGKRTVVFLLLLPVLTPPLASTMGVHAIFLHYGLTDSLVGVVLVHLISTVPYCVLMLSSSFANFDTDWEAQARTLGHRRWRTGGT